MDIVEIFQNRNFHTNYKLFTTLLLRKSYSITFISPEVIQHEIIEKLSLKPKKRDRMPSDLTLLDLIAQKSINQANLKNTLSSNSKNTSEVSPKEQLANITQQSLLKIADAFYTKSLTLHDIIHEEILDRIIDGKEHQLVKRNKLMESFEKLGIKFSIPEYITLKELFTPVFEDYAGVVNLQKFLADLGIKENIPKSDRHFSFEILEPVDIRLFNRIINYLNFNEVDRFDKILKPEYISTVHLISKNKEQEVKVISFNSLQKFLKEVKIMKPSEDLSDTFTEFLELSHENSELCMIRKITKALSLIEKSKYYRYFGTKRRGQQKLNLYEIQRGPSGALRALSNDFEAPTSKVVIKEFFEKKIDKITKEIQNTPQDKTHLEVSDPKKSKFDSLLQLHKIKSENLGNLSVGNPEKRGKLDSQKRLEYGIPSDLQYSPRGGESDDESF